MKMDLAELLRRHLDGLVTNPAQTERLVADLELDWQLLLDRVCYGASYERRLLNGTRERIDPCHIKVVTSLSEDETDGATPVVRDPELHRRAVDAEFARHLHLKGTDSSQDVEARVAGCGWSDEQELILRVEVKGGSHCYAYGTLALKIAEHPTGVLRVRRYHIGGGWYPDDVVVGFVPTLSDEKEDPK